MFSRTAVLIWITATGAYAQLPVIHQQGVVNAASYGPPMRIASGGIVSIFGQNLASATIQAPGTPLPLELGGTSVTIDGLPAPLFFVSPGQINVQTPHGLRAGFTRPESLIGPVAVVVRTAAGASTG